MGMTVTFRMATDVCRVAHPDRQTSATKNGGKYLITELLVE
jgi:hypothetical protein